MKSGVSTLSPALRKKCKKRVQPTIIAPMLATLTDRYFSDKDWIYEKKFDGIRIITYKKNGRVRLMSRNGLLYNKDFPDLVAALEKQPADNFILDGEIVAIGKRGISDFQLLQERKTAPSIRVVYYVFDLMYIDGYDIQALPLKIRKQLLKKTLRFTRMIAYTSQARQGGVPFFRQACRHGWEGIMAKDADSAYVNKRSSLWLKFKCALRQELVIGGYTQPQGSRVHFGALLVGYYTRGKLHYAGKVGTGYSQETLAMLGRRLKKLRTAHCPFIDYGGPSGNTVWVKPTLVGEFSFAQWTKGGKLRVGRFKGLRKDKRARDVIRERPKHVKHV